MPLTYTLTNLASQIPLILVCLIGILCAVPRLDRNPRPGLLVMAGLGLYMLIGIAQMLLQAPIQQILSSNLGLGRTSPDLRIYYAAINLGFNVIRALSLGLLVMAAFADRTAVALITPQPPTR